MKLLFDQNISFRIVKSLESHFEKVTQVRLENLENSADRDIWEYAKRNDFIIATFDSDFYDFSVIWGAPPKIILIKSFDQTTRSIANLLIEHKKSIVDFENDQSIDCLEIIKNAP